MALPVSEYDLIRFRSLGLVLFLKGEFFSSREDAFQGGVEVDEALVGFRGDGY